jgi:Flp pilus assembly protein TadD
MLHVAETKSNTPRIPIPRRAALLGVLVAVALLALGLSYGAWLGWVYWNAPSLAEVDRLFARHSYAEADRKARAYLAWNPTDARAILTLAKSRAARNDLTGCVVALALVPENSIRKTEALLRAAQAYQQMNRGRDAERLYKACIVHDPSGQSYAMTAREWLAALLAMEERREAFRALAWEIYDLVGEARRLRILTMRTRIEFEQTQPDINARSLEAYVRADPGDSDARAGLAAALDHKGEAHAALPLYARAVAEKRSDPELLERYLDLLHRMGELPTLETALAAHPAGAAGRPAIQKFLGIVAESAGNLEAAEAAYRKAVQLDPNEPEYRHRHSLVLARLGRSDESAQEAAVRARLRSAQAELRKAWNQFADAYDLDPERISLELILGMARASEACGLTREAAGWYREVLFREPGNALARTALGGLERPHEAAGAR